MSAVKFKFSGDSAELLKELENIKEKIRGASEQAAKVSPGKGAAADVEGLGASFKNCCLLLLRRLPVWRLLERR